MPVTFTTASLLADSRKRDLCESAGYFATEY